MKEIAGFLPQNFITNESLTTREYMTFVVSNQKHIDTFLQIDVKDRW